MKIIFSSIKENEVEDYSSNIKHLNELNHSKIIKSFVGVENHVILNKVDEILAIKIKSKVELIAYSSYTLKPFKYKMNIDDELFYSIDPTYESEDVFLIDNEFDLDDIIYSLIITSMPLNAHPKNEKPIEGDGYRVLKEEDLDVESSPFDKLKDLDL